MSDSFRSRTRNSWDKSLCQEEISSDAQSSPSGEIDSEFQFAVMAIAYARHGGMPRAEEVVEWMRSRRDQPVSVVAKWIASRELITLHWHQQMLVPMFQIDPCSGGLRLGCREIIAELKDVMDDWEMARWFATTNPWLCGLPPVDVLASSWREVIDAARVARFIARG